MLVFYLMLFLDISAVMMLCENSLELSAATIPAMMPVDHPIRIPKLEAGNRIKKNEKDNAQRFL